MSEVQKFSELDLIAPIARAVAEEGYEIPTPIQMRSIPHLLKGRDLLGCAQTGTGKTAAFALPVLQRLAKSGSRGGGHRRIRSLIMTPTRELAAQIGESFQTYGRHLSLTGTVIFGGVSQRTQERALKRGPDILVATPGRLLDLMQQKLISLKHLEYFVLDEADRMLDMGFIHDVRRVIDALPEKRQSIFFSATMPPAVAKLADRMLTDPVRVEVASQSVTVDLVDQALMFVDRGNKRKLLETLLQDATISRALVFSRTKRGADRIRGQLTRRKIAVEAIHGDRSQNARTNALKGFRTGRVRVLVATDIAARGIDVDDVSHVINFDLPNEPESYVHRIGRTARAGRAGKAISFCSGDELVYLRDIERLLRQKVPVDRSHDFHSDDAARGFENGVPAETPRQRQARQQAERARWRRPAGPRSANRGPKPQSTNARRPKERSKAVSPSKNRRRSRRSGGR